MKTKTYVVYKFGELSEEVKQKAIENYRDINVDFNGWEKYILLEWKEKLEKVGFNNVEIHYRGFASQGDEACFDGTIDIDKFITPKYAYLKKAIKKGIIEVTGRINSNGYGNHYSHEHTRYITLDTRYHGENLGIWNKLLILVNNLQKKIEHIRLNYCKEIYQELENKYNYLTSKEAIIETFEANDYDFTTAGKID